MKVIGKLLDDAWKTHDDYVNMPLEEYVNLLKQAVDDIPKKTIVTDYTHFMMEDYEEYEKTGEFTHHEKNDYPKYVRESTNEEWNAWVMKWFGSE